jgi:hypothetical protein
MPPFPAATHDASGRVQQGTSRAAGSAVWRPWLLTIPFLVVLYVQLARHALWRDELNAFGIAAGSRSLGDLLHNVHYEGHPWLWYALLWVASKATHAPGALKVVQGIIGTATLLTIGFASPFRWWQKLLLLCNYYVIFEYTVMSRMYGLVLLFALLYLRERVRCPRRPVLCAFWLGLMASADATGVLVSIAFVAELLWSTDWNQRLARRGWLPVGVYGVLVCLAVGSMLLPHDRSAQDSGILFGARPLLLVDGALANYVVVTYLPTLVRTPGHFWGAAADQHRKFFTLMVPLVLAAYWVCLGRRKNLWILLGTALALLISLGALVYSGSPRHFGLAFVAFLGCLWIESSEGKDLQWPAYVLLALLSVAGIHATVASWRRPFSNAAAAGRWIQAHVPEAVPLIGTPDSTTIGVAEEAQRPMYMLECQCSMSFLRFASTRNGYTRAQMAARMSVALNRLHADGAVLVWDHVATAAEMLSLQAVGLSVVPLQAYPGAEAPGEDFFLYKVQRSPLAAVRFSGKSSGVGARAGAAP